MNFLCIGELITIHFWGQCGWWFRVFESKEMWEYLAGRVQGWTMHWIGLFVPRVWHQKERLIGTSEKQSWRSLKPAFQVSLEHWGSCSYLQFVFILDLPKYSVNELRSIISDSYGKGSVFAIRLCRDVLFQNWRSYGSGSRIMCTCSSLVFCF